MIMTTTMIYDDYDDEAIQFFLAITMMYDDEFSKFTTAIISDDNDYDLDDDDDDD